MSPVPRSDTADPRRLSLGPATRLLWRSSESVHLELGNRAVVLDGAPPHLLRLLASRTQPAGEMGPDLAAETRDAFDGLLDAGFLWTRSNDPADTRLHPPAPRLARELTALAARHGANAADVLCARRAASVVVSGANAAGVHLAALLAAAGVGRVWCSAHGSARLAHAMPGGVVPGDEGSELSAAATAAIGRAAPDAETVPLPPGRQPDLTVLAAQAPVDEERRYALHAAHAAHLLVGLAADHGVVGPLVLPGLTSCLRCADLHRRDRDPAWPALAAQLAVAPARGAAMDVAMATVIVGTAAVQALAFLDGGDPACIDASLELHLPDWRLRRRTRGPHPECDCTRPAQ